MNDSYKNGEDALDSRLLDDYEDPNPSATTTHYNQGNPDSNIAATAATLSSSTAAAATAAATTMLPKLQVTAPETLPEGYTFDVQVNDTNSSARQVYTLRVPYGGIRKGDIFAATPITATANHNTSYEQQRHAIPRNAWKDSLFDICKYGPFHSHFLIGCCCPCISLGQIFTRLNIDLYDRPLPEYHTTNATNATNANAIPTINDPSSSSCRLSKRDTTTFRLLVALNFMYFSLMMVVSMANYDSIPFHHFHFLYLSITTILAARMRFYLRTTLDIPTLWQSLLARNGGRAGSRCDAFALEEDATCCGTNVDAATVVGVVEDVAVNAFCGPCSIMQMNRHTGMYDTYQGHCFNSTGMPKYAPVAVV